MNNSPSKLDPKLVSLLQEGLVIPAHPLALNAHRKLDERRQRALTRYYSSAGVGGLAVGVHTTQFQIRDSNIGLFEPVLELAAEEMSRSDRKRSAPLLRIGGICGKTPQAILEAALLQKHAYHVGLLSLSALYDASEQELITHCKQVSEVIPIVGFYLQESVGGRCLSYSFWRRLCDLENLVAIKIAPFNRYRTLDVIRAVVDAGRDDVALYTGNDDNIVIDLLTTYRFSRGGVTVKRRIVGGLLGHWAVWTKRSVELLASCHSILKDTDSIPHELLTLAQQVTDANAAFFDAANGFQGVIAGLHEVLRRQGLFEGTWCLSPTSTLGQGQIAEIDRVYTIYPHLNDDEFVATNLDHWLSG